MLLTVAKGILIYLRQEGRGENLHDMRTKRDRLGHLLDAQSWTT